MSSDGKGKQPVSNAFSREPSYEPGWVRKRATAIDVTEGLRALIGDDNATPRATNPANVAPTIRSTSNNQPLRKKSGAITPVQRPKLTRKAATAPPGTLALFSANPQPPRRAISARAARFSRSGDSRSRRDSMNPLLPRISQLGTPASRSVIGRRKSSRKPVGKLGLKPKTIAWKLVSPVKLKKYDMISEKLEDRRRLSFSEKARVRETLKNKNVEYLKTNIVDFKERELPDTPTSMVNTPRELYGTSPEVSKDTYEKPQSKARIRLVLRPISPNKRKHFSLPLTPLAQELAGFRTPISDQWTRNVYVPGPTILPSAILFRRTSTLPLGPFEGESGVIARRLSEDAILDDIAEYFEDLGIIDEAAEDELDRFWEQEREDTIYHGPVAPSSKAFRTLGLDVPPHSPDRPPIPTLLLSNSALLPTTRSLLQQDEKQLPPPSPTPRPRIGLRRLLNSATSII